MERSGGDGPACGRSPRLGRRKTTMVCSTVVVNYLQWTYDTKPLCVIDGTPEYCHPRFYKGLPDQLFLNQGDGHLQGCFQGVGIRDHVGKGMGVGMADFDLDRQNRTCSSPTTQSTTSCFTIWGNKSRKIGLRDKYRRWRKRARSSRVWGGIFGPSTTTATPEHLLRGPEPADIPADSAEYRQGRFPGK